MNISNVLTGLIIITIFSFSCNTRDQLTHIDLRSAWDTLKVIENPHKGWYHHYYDCGIGKYLIKDEEMFKSFPGMDHLYLRLAWSFLEPEEGQFNWEVIDTVIARYVPMGYKIAFRVTCKETGSISTGSVPEEINGVRYATPSWVQRAGAKGVVPEKPRSPSWTPVWDDPVYLEKLNNFHKAFARRYNAQPYVLYIDVGSIGDWGEGHTSFSTNVPPTVKEVKSNIDIYLKNYKKTQIVVTDGLLFWGKNEDQIKELYGYAISNGITLRDDSPMVYGHIKNYFDTWSVSHPHFYDPLYMKKPIIFEAEHYSFVKRDGNWLGKNGEEIIPAYGVSGSDIFRNSIKTMHATYIGFLEDFLNDNPDLTGELLNTCGYWYFPVSVSFPEFINKSENTIEISWFNKGVAPAYNSYSLILRIEEVNNKSNIYDITLYDSGNKNWLPGMIYSETYNFNLPSDIRNGNYHLKFKLKDTYDTKRDIFLGIQEKLMDSFHFITTGQVIINKK